MWHVTCAAWHVTQDTWCITGGRRWTFLQYFSFLALTVWELEVTCDTWHVTSDTGHLTCDTWLWHVLRDTQGAMNIMKMSYGLGVKVVKLWHKTSLLRRWHADPCQYNSIGKIHPFSKIFVTFESVMWFGCPLRFRFLWLKAPSSTIMACRRSKDIFTNHQLMNEWMT